MKIYIRPVITEKGVHYQICRKSLFGYKAFLVDFTWGWRDSLYAHKFKTPMDAKAHAREFIDYTIIFGKTCL